MNNKNFSHLLVIALAFIALFVSFSSCEKETIHELSYTYESSIEMTIVVGDTATTPHVANCSANPKDWIALANGFACDFSYENAANIAYFSWICLDANHTKTYPQIERDLRSGQRFRPNDNGIAVCSNLRPNTKYQLFVMAVSKDEENGDLIKVDFSTPRKDDVRVPISEIWVDGGYWNWSVTPLPACHGYHMMTSSEPGVADEPDVLKAFWIKEAIDLGMQSQYFNEGIFKERKGDQLAVWTWANDGYRFSGVIETRASSTATTRSDYRQSDGDIVLSKGKHLSPEHYQLYAIH